MKIRVKQDHRVITRQPAIMDPDGHRLGSLTGDSKVALTPEQIRERRLQALGGGSGPSSPSTTTANPTRSPPRPEAIPPPVKKTTFLVDDDDAQDAELQAALALSLQTFESDERNATAAYNPTPAASTTSQPTPAIHIPPTPSNILDEIWNSDEPFDVIPFHELMWDAATTTENDKTRWVAEAIRTLQDEPKLESATRIETDATMLSQLVQTEHPILGLVQHFGGPCGVLAAVQAEALRILIWGAKALRNDVSTELTSVNDLDIPTAPTQLLSGLALDSQIVRVALARAIAIILTRAALQPAVVDEDRTKMDTETESKPAAINEVVRIVLPARLTMPTDMASEKHESHAITWTDLEPWEKPSGTPHDTTIERNRLRKYSIQLKYDMKDAWNKRQKTDTGSSTDAANESRTHGDGLETNHLLLTRLVGDFLLQSSERSTAPIDYFFREGGVLLLVMSLVSSRGHQRIQSEFDDPAGSKLTAQFGHCSQELMNLLLTGQAVSNVFDNNLSPDKGIVCRGVQQQSDIGYLTQLEALRYCQVGSYFKTPVFPVWVVGSTSHFTVLFGDNFALQESPTNQLLEKCRRAFKAGGADEHGLITSEQLVGVFRELDLDVKGSEQAIAASIEMAGTGIVLWQDFWRVAQQLMTGSSVEAVLNSSVSASDSRAIVPFNGNGANDIPPLISAGAGPAETDEEMARRMDRELNSTAAQGPMPRPHSPMDVEAETNLTDEELARKLQAEWDAEGDGASDRAAAGSPASLPDLVSGPAISTSMHLDNDSDVSNGESISLYHYNGLRGGKLKRFRIVREIAQAGFGDSIPMALDAHHIGSSNGGLDDIVRTKWPACRIDWMGQPLPEID